MELARDISPMEAEHKAMTLCMLLQRPGVFAVLYIADDLQDAVNEAGIADMRCPCSENLTYAQVVENLRNLPLATPVKNAFYPSGPSAFEEIIKSIKSFFSARVLIIKA